jgi:DASH complex subunit DAD2
MSSNDTSHLTATQLRLYEKQQEYASLLALRQASGQMLDRVEELGKMSQIMADGGQAVSSVLRNWNQVFSILNLFGE